MQDVIAVVFDFDDTLAPCTTTGFLNDLGINAGEFWVNEVDPLVHQGWDPIPAYLYKIIGLAKDYGITQQKLAEWGARAPLFQGVEQVFDRLREHTRSINSQLAIEFYVISSGIGEVLRHTSIAHEFTDIWSSDFSYAADGTIEFPKRLVSFTDKTRYLFQVSKGIYGPESRKQPFDVNLKFEKERKRIPFQHMVFVGDGYTDIPCFALIRKQRGIAIGVYDQHDRQKWGRAWGFIEQQRVSNLAPADYREDSALTHSLIMAVESISQKIELAASTYQG